MARKQPAPDSTAWRWALGGGALGFAVAVVVFAPAHWVAQGVSLATQGRVQLADPRGTVWHGSAQLALTGGPGSNDAAALPGRIDWSLSPRFNGLAAKLHAACCSTAPIGVRLRWRWAGPSLSVGPVALRVPAAALAGLGTPFNTLQLDGDLLLSTKGLSVEWPEGRLAMAGGAELVAQNVSSRLSTLRPMGSYRITVLGGAAPTLRLETLGGSLQLSGSGQWIGSRLRFRGEAMAAPDREAALSNLLNIMGRRSGPKSIITIG